MIESTTSIRSYGLSETFRLPDWEGLRARFDRRQTPSPVLVYWAIFAASVTMAVLEVLIGDASPKLGAALAIGSCVTCGHSWLLTRSLFRPDPTFEIWPIAIVGGLFGMVCLLYLADMTGAENWAAAKVIGTLVSFTSSTILVLTFVEAFGGGLSTAKGPERRFRILFIAGYACLFAVGVILFRSGLDIPGLQDVREPSQAICAFLAMVLASLAVHYRLSHPLQAAGTAKRREVSEQTADPVLCDRVRRAVIEQRGFIESDLKVAELASRLGVPEYKVSNCVTRGFGFSNFNQFLNHYRIEEVKRQLADPTYDGTPILTIAMESGFGSIGPFNRAFKAQVGETPGTYRRQMKAMRVS